MGARRRRPAGRRVTPAGAPGAAPPAEHETDVLLKPRRFGEIEPTTRFRFTSVPQVVVHRQLAVVSFACTLAVVSSWIAMSFEPRPAIAFFFALVGGVGVFLEPFLGVVAYYTLAFMRPQETLWGLGDTRLTLLVSVSTIASTLLHFAGKPNLSFLKQKQCFFIAVLWLFIFLSTIFGDFAAPEAKWMDYYNKLFLIYFVVLAVTTSEKKLYILAWVLMLSIGYLAYWANEMYFLAGWSVVHGPGKPGATYYDENDFAMVLVMSAPFTWYMMRGAKNPFVKLGLLGLLPLTAHAVMVTFSRGGFLGLAASMAVVALRDRNRALGGSLIAGGLVFFALFAGAEYRARIQSINTYEEDRSATGRLESWEAGTRMATHNPLFGVGLKRYMDAFPYYSNFQPRVAHNSWVQLGAECGLVALACYGALIVLTLRAVRRVERRIPLLEGEIRTKCDTLAKSVMAATVGYVVCGFFLSMEDFEGFYILVAMGQVLDRITEVRVAEASALREAAQAVVHPEAAPA